jgi:hypothetical protein
MRTVATRVSVFGSTHCQFAKVCNRSRPTIELPNTVPFRSPSRSLIWSMNNDNAGRSMHSSNILPQSSSSSLGSEKSEPSTNVLTSAWEPKMRRPRAGICVSVFRQPRHNNASSGNHQYHEVLLVKRGKPPAQHQWAFPG